MEQKAHIQRGIFLNQIRTSKLEWKKVHRKSGDTDTVHYKWKINFTRDQKERNERTKGPVYVLKSEKQSKTNFWRQDALK